MTHVGERMKLLNCVTQDMEALAKILASAPRAVSKYRANVPDHLSGHCKMAAGSGLRTRLVHGCFAPYKLWHLSFGLETGNRRGD